MKRKTVFTAIIFMLFLTSVPGILSAEMKSGAFTLSPQVGGYVFESDQRLSNGPVYGLGFGYNYTERFGVEGVFNYIDTESKSTGGSDVKGYIYRIDSLYHFMPDKQLVPYIAAGIGAISIDDDQRGTDTGMLFNYGAGIKYFLTKTVVFRSDIRHILTFNDSNNNFAYTFGISFMFGGKVKEVAPPAPKPEPAPILPPPPAPEPEPEPAPPPEPAPTPSIPPVEEPEEAKVIILEDVHFEFDKATLTEEAKTMLKKNIQTLREDPGIRIRIEGHSCAHGPEDYNLRLSERRANAVKEYLVNEGDIASERMTTIAYGETRLAMPEVPTPYNKNSKEAKANRRVHFEVIVQ